MTPKDLEWFVAEATRRERERCVAICREVAACDLESSELILREMQDFGDPCYNLWKGRHFGAQRCAELIEDGE